MKRLVIAGLLFAAGAAQGQSWLDHPSLHLGGGFGTAEVENEPRTTLQLFAGVDTLQEAGYRGGVEAGVVDASDSSKDSLWVAGVIAWSSSPDISWFGRAGLDLGSDAGWMAGGGVGYFIEPGMEVRMEVAGRDQGTGIQFNLAWYPNRHSYP